MSRLRENIGKQFHLQELQRNQIPSNKLNKGVNDLYKKNYLIYFLSYMKKEIEDYRRWKDLPCLWIGRINK
jgi:hypothetical protein